MEDFEVIDCVLSGDKEKFKILVDKYYYFIRNVCYSVFGNSLDLEEVAQEVIIRMYTSLPKFNKKSEFKSYVYRIAYNTSISLYAKKRPEYTNNIESYENIMVEPSVETVFLEKEKLQQLKKALCKLPKVQKYAIIMHTYKGLKYDEIATKLNCSLSKVESIIFRGKKNLKNYIKKIICRYGI